MYNFAVCVQDLCNFALCEQPACATCVPRLYSCSLGSASYTVPVQDYVSKLAVLLVSAKGDPDSEAGAEVQVIFQPIQSVLLFHLNTICQDVLKHCVHNVLVNPDVCWVDRQTANNHEIYNDVKNNTASLLIRRYFKPDCHISHVATSSLTPSLILLLIHALT